MDSKFLFSETQQFRQWWLWGIMFVANTVFIFLLYYQYINNIKNTSIFVLAGTTFIILLGGLLLYITKLDTRIDQKSVRYRFSPFFSNWQEILWTNVDKAAVIKYKPITDVKGYGIKRGRDGRKVYNVSGNYGLDLILKNDKKILIGTQQPKGLEKLIPKIMHN